MNTPNPSTKAMGVCPQCARQVEIGSLVGAKLGGAAVGAYVGDRATDHWLGVLAGALIGGAIGHVIDKAVLPSCPMCRVALEIANVMI
jgi:outer membrane lipoprotein SlyB